MGKLDQFEQEDILPPLNQYYYGEMIPKVQTRKPELTESQKRMGLRSRRFLDQSEWTDWD